LRALFQWRQAVSKYENKIDELRGMQPASSLVSALERLQATRSELAVAQFRAGWTERLTRSLAHNEFRTYLDLVDRAAQLRWENMTEDRVAEWARQVATLAKDLPIWIVTNLAARRALVIGDPHQLRHTSTFSARDQIELAAEHGTEDEVSFWSYNQRSLYNLAEDAAGRLGRAVGFLAEHYRSHPDIVEFSDRSFHSGRLVVRTPLAAFSARLGAQPLGVFWHDTPAGVPPSSRSAWNEAEVEAAVGLISQWHSNGLFHDSRLTVGIVTPFRLQMGKPDQRIAECPWHRPVARKIIVGAAHRFQGDECDFMIFSPAVARDMLPRLVRWVADTEQLLNVAITRARGALHVVGDMQACLAAGGRLAEFTPSVQAGLSASADTQQTESPAEHAVAETLCELGPWHKCQYAAGRYRLDLLVVSPTGSRYHLEVDGRGHLTDEALRSDGRRDEAMAAQRIKVVRIDARSVF
jgi:very-short-patch-repair endonuclease